MKLRNWPGDSRNMRLESLLPYRPIIPPRKCFVDSYHYAAMLSFLDGWDRLVAARASSDSEHQGWFASWALKSFERAQEYLASSNAGRFYGQSFRPEFAPEAIARATETCRHEALSLLTQEFLSISKPTLFFGTGPIYVV